MAASGTPATDLFDKLSAGAAVGAAAANAAHLSYFLPQKFAHIGCSSGNSNSLVSNPPAMTLRPTQGAPPVAALPTVCS